MATSTVPTARRFRRIRAALTPAEWRRAAAMAAVVVGLHVVGFVVLIAFVAPQHYAIGAGGIFGIGVGITAYTLGLRHAFDADHIAAIDNTTRKLISEGQRPLSVGFFFSLGHSTVVFALTALIAVGINGLTGAVEDDGSTLQQTTGLIGPLVSGSFLILIGLLNLVVLLGIARIFRRARSGEFDERELDRQLERRGLLNRLYHRATRAVRKPWHMYPLGLLFGLGFDTATEVALLVLAGTAAGSGLPFYALLCLPVLFAAGMTLFDTLDGAFMNVAYGWAGAQPIRKLFYNLTITSLSVVVALLIGTIELLAVLGEELDLSGGIWGWASSVDLNLVGYAIVGLFVATWAIALTLWRFGRIEQRWSPVADREAA